MILTGEGGPKDPVKARELAQRAADAGYPRAIFQLSEILRAGIGGPKNIAMADVWKQKSGR